MFRSIGMFVVARARLVLVIGALALVGAGVLGVGAFSKLQPAGFEDPNSESTLAAQALEDGYGGSANVVLQIGAHAGSVDDAAVRAAGIELTDTLRADERVEQVVSYWETRAPALRSTDGTSALVLASVPDEDDAVLDDVRANLAPDAPIDVRFGGQLPIFSDVESQLAGDLSRAESIAIPVTLLLLVLAFGNVVAAVLVVAIGGIAILGTFAELSVFGALTDVSIYAINLTVGLGLGLAVDYGLLMVSRFREERKAGNQIGDAVVRSVETAGRTIAFSAATVAIALGALLVFPMYFLRSMAYAGIGVIAIAATSALLVLPALLTVLGERTDGWKVPWRKAVPGAESPRWARIAGFVMRRPVLTAVPVVAVLLVAASPLLGAQFGSPDDRVLPASAESRQVGDSLRSDFAVNSQNSIDVITTSAVPADSLADYARALSELPHAERVDSSVGTFAAGQSLGSSPGNPMLSGDNSERLTLLTTVDANSELGAQLVRDARAVADPAGSTALVGGRAAVNLDTTDAIGDRLALVVGLIVASTFVLLFAFTGSVLQPIRALLLGALGLAATLGTMVFIFQQGHLAGLLGFTPMPLNISMLILLFCIAFGLSMDYEVFVLSRIKEMHDAGADNHAAVTQGLARSGRLVTTAAALLAVSFFAFVSSEVSFIQFFGLGTGLAILIDATLIRGILVPASMRLLGRFAWSAPRPLRRLHARVALAEAGSAPR